MEEKMKKIKYALLALLAIFTVVVTGCKNPEDQTALTEVTSISDFGKDSLYLRAKSDSYKTSTSNYSKEVSYYTYLYLENGKLYSQNYRWVEKTYTDTSKEKETYWEKGGEPTELSFTDGKISAGDSSSADTMCKLGDTYFMYYDSMKLSRISGTGLYSTFEYTENDNSSKVTFKDDGTVISESSYKDSDGNTQSSSTALTYKNNNGLISFYDSDGTKTSLDAYYDGSAIYNALIFEEVSELPTVTK
jgi:hypothetical protein